MPELTPQNAAPMLLLVIGYLMFIAFLLISIYDAVTENPTGTFRGFLLKLVKNLYSLCLVFSVAAIALTALSWVIYAGFRLLANLFF